MPVKGAKGKKRKVDETNLQEPADLEGVENPAFENSVLEDEDFLRTPNREDSCLYISLGGRVGLPN